MTNENLVSKKKLESSRFCTAPALFSRDIRDSFFYLDFSLMVNIGMPRKQSSFSPIARSMPFIGEVDTRCGIFRERNGIDRVYDIPRAEWGPPPLSSDRTKLSSYAITSESVIIRVRCVGRFGSTSHTRVISIYAIQFQQYCAAPIPSLTQRSDSANAASFVPDGITNYQCDFERSLTHNQ